MAVVSVGGIVYYSAQSAKQLTQQDTVVLADFVNRTGDPVFDDTLKQALSVELTQSPFLHVSSDLQVRGTLRRMGLAPSTAVTPEVAVEVCLRMGNKAILVGSISNLGSHYVVGLEALGCAGGDTLAMGQAEALDKESVLKALDRVASQVRGKVGESLSSLEKYDFPVDATTNSLEALKVFSAGLKALRDSSEGDAIPFLRDAIVLDPNFALAYTVLGRAYENVGEDAEAVQNLTRAYELRGRLSQREQYHINTLYHETVTGDLQKAKEAGELWVQTYPRDGYAREKLATVYADLGEIEKAYDQAREALRLDPESTVNVYNAVVAGTGANRSDEAREILTAARALGLDGVAIRQSMYSLAFLSGDFADMERQVAWATGKVIGEEALLSQHSDSEAYYGRLRRARELSRRSAEAASRDGAKEIAATCELVSILRDVEAGNIPSATSIVHSGLALAPTREVKVLAALALARTGDSARTQALIKELENKNPSNTLIRFYWLPTIKASLEIHSGDSQAAASLLEAAATYDLSQTSNLTYMWTMYPAYIRGNAYLLAHNAEAAKASFNKVLDHSGLVQNSIIAALSRLQLARADVMISDKVAAHKEYQVFLSLWKDADPDIPILKEAKAEYAKLQ